MMTKEQALNTLRDYVERSTHWTEGGATRHDAKLALKALAEDAVCVPNEWAGAIQALDNFGLHTYEEVTAAIRGK